MEKCVEIQLKNTVFYGHRDYIELYGEYMEMNWLSTICCDVMNAVKDVLM